MVVAITGASGSKYAAVLLQRLQELADQTEQVAVVMTEAAQAVWKHEMGDDGYRHFPFPMYDRQDFSAPFASGSSGYQSLIVCPCSMGTLGRIAHGSSDDLITRAADVMLKERRKLILVIREAPFHLIHIRNMLTITEAGGIVFPASPAFYMGPATIDDMVRSVVDRVLLLAGFQFTHFQWGS